MRGLTLTFGTILNSLPSRLVASGGLDKSPDRRGANEKPPIAFNLSGNSADGEGCG